MKNYIIKILDGFTIGLFCSLIVGTIIFELGRYLGANITLPGDLLLSDLLQNVGTIFKNLMGPSICLGIAIKLGYSHLVQLSSIAIGLLAANPLDQLSTSFAIGDPLLILFVSVTVLLILHKIEKPNTMEILWMPAVAAILSVVFIFLYTPLTSALNLVLDGLNPFFEQFPLVSSVFIAIIFAVFISGPVSSAALAVILGISGEAAFIAVIATMAQMSGFFFISLKDNSFKNCFLILIGTSKLQLTNIYRNFFIFLGPLAASVILAVSAGILFDYTSTTAAAGMGLCALIGPILTYAEQPSFMLLSVLVAFGFILPMIISYVVYQVLFKSNFIKKGDLSLKHN